MIEKQIQDLYQMLEEQKKAHTAFKEQVTEAFRKVRLEVEELKSSAAPAAGLEAPGPVLPSTATPAGPLEEAIELLTDTINANIREMEDTPLDNLLLGANYDCESSFSWFAYPKTSTPNRQYIMPSGKWVCPILEAANRISFFNTGNHNPKYTAKHLGITESISKRPVSTVYTPDATEEQLLEFQELEFNHYVFRMGSATDIVNKPILLAMFYHRYQTLPSLEYISNLARSGQGEVPFVMSGGCFNEYKNKPENAEKERERRRILANLPVRGAKSTPE